MKVTSFHFLFLHFINNTSLVTQSEIFASTFISLSKSRIAKTGSIINISFNLLNAFLYSFLHLHFSSFLTSRCKRAAILAKFLINCLQQFANPRNFCIFFIFFGTSQLRTSSTFFFYISTLQCPITTPRNSISFTFYQHFSSLTNRSFFFSLFNIFSTSSLYPSLVSMTTIISSINVAVFL